MNFKFIKIIFQTQIKQFVRYCFFCEKSLLNLKSILIFYICILTMDSCIGSINAINSSKKQNSNNIKKLHNKHINENTNNNVNDRTYENENYFNYGNTRSVNYNTESCQLNIECNNNHVGPLKLPIYGPKGDQGPPGMTGLKGSKGEPGVDGIPAREPPPPNFSAFFAALANNTGPFTQDKDLVFTHVITNYGNNYDSTTGHYTAPYNGIYQFVITISATGRQKAGVNVMKNKHSILTVWSESEPWSTSSQTVILKLSVNDRVYLRLQSRASHVHGYMYSSFGGNLIYEEINAI